MEQAELDSPSLDLLFQYFQALFLRALPSVNSAVVTVGLMVIQHVVDRNQQSVRHRENDPFVTPPWC